MYVAFFIVRMLFSLSAKGGIGVMLTLRGPAGGMRFVILPRGNLCLIGGSGGLWYFVGSLDSTECLVLFCSASWFSRSFTWIKNIVNGANVTKAIT